MYRKGHRIVPGYGYQRFGYDISSLWLVSELLTLFNLRISHYWYEICQNSASQFMQIGEQDCVFQCTVEHNILST